MSDGTVNGGFHNYGTMIAGDNAVEFVHDSVLNGGIYNYKDAIMAGGLAIDATAGTDFTNNGLLVLKAGATQGNEKNTGNIIGASLTGNFTQGSTGETNFYIDSNTTAGTTYTSFIITGNATFSANAKLSMDVKSNGSNLNNNDVFQDILTTTGTLNTSTFYVTDNSMAWKFIAVNDGNNIDLTAISTGLTTVEAAADIKDKGAGKALDSITNDEIKQALYNLNTKKEVQQVVKTTIPQTTIATFATSGQISNGIASIVTQRQNANIAEGLNSGDRMFADKNFWFKPFGSIGSQNDKDGISGFDLKTQGFGLGLDGEYKNNQNIGFGLFYTNANVDINNISQEADLDVFTVLVYGNVPVIDDKTNFLYQTGYSWQKTNGSREIFTGDIATSDYTSKTASLDLKLMRDVQLNDNLLLQPLVESTYRHFTNPSYEENGAGALNLNVDKFTSSDLIVGLGTLAHYKLTDDSKIVGNVNIGYDLHGKNQTVTSSFEGAAGFKFNTDGIDNGKWSYQAGIGYEKELNKTNSLNISYDYQAQGTDFSNNTVSAKYLLKF